MEPPIAEESLQDPSLRGVSERLKEFVLEQPYVRVPILRFVRRAADMLARDATVLDVGAGEAPYRELFEHVNYIALDHAASPHAGLAELDVVASGHEIPLPAAHVDGILLTEVLEHVPEPVAVLAEARRVLRPDGLVFVTVPLVWHLHEEPDDYYRYTRAGLVHIAERAGLTVIEVEARGNYLTTVAQLLLNSRWMMGSNKDGLDRAREELAHSLTTLADHLGELLGLDARHVLPLGYTMICGRGTT